MKKNTILKIFLALLAFIPLGLRFQALVAEWTRAVNGFQVNLADPFFMLLGFVMILALIFYRRSEAGAVDLYAVPGILISFAALLIGIFCKDNAFYFAAALLFPAFVIWFLFGWRFFYRIFPVPLMFLLGLPTMLYLRFFPAITLNWKIAIASALCLYTFFALLTDFNPPRRRSACFAFGVIVFALLFAAIPQIAPKKGDHFLPAKEFTVKIDPSNVVPVPLAITLSGDNVIASRQEYLNIDGACVAVLRLNCRTRNGKNYLVYTWFTSQNHFSTGDYRVFRKAASGRDQWYLCTLRLNSDPEKSEKTSPLKK